MIINVFRMHIMNTIEDLRYYRNMHLAAVNPGLKQYYEHLIRKRLIQLDYLLGEIERELEKIQRGQQREFTKEELAFYDGSGGRPAYVAVNGIVYDVSLNPTWGGGTHFGLYAGNDLTEQFNGCHQNVSILNQLPIVGVLKN